MVKYLTFYARETTQKNTQTCNKFTPCSLLDVAVGFYNIIVMLHYYIIIYSVLSLRFIFFCILF